MFKYMDTACKQIHTSFGDKAKTWELVSFCVHVLEILVTEFKAGQQLAIGFSSTKLAATASVDGVMRSSPSPPPHCAGDIEHYCYGFYENKNNIKILMRYHDYFAQPEHDPFNGNYTEVLAPYRIPLANQDVQTPAAVQTLSLNCANQNVPTVFLLQHSTYTSSWQSFTRKWVSL